MILVKPSFEVMAIMEMDLSHLLEDRHEQMHGSALDLIELAGRTCYKSEDKITPDSAEKFVRMVRDRGHHSVIEHSAVTVKIICDRGVTHELVRHRLAAYSQESTRYCNYYKGGVTFVIPPWVNLEPGEVEPDWYSHEPSSPISDTNVWYVAVMNAEMEYLELLERGWSPQQARSVLPNSLKTEIVITANFREWLHIFTLRCSKAAHPQMREIMIPLCEKFKKLIPVVFDNVSTVL